MEKVLFQHIRSARAEANSGLLLGLFMLVTGAIPAYIGYQIARATVEELGKWSLLLPFEVYALALFGVILLLMAMFILGLSTLRLLAGGQWQVMLSTQELLWQEPAFANESFRLPLAEIEALVVRRRRKVKSSGKIKYKEGYVLRTRAGREYMLLNQFGLDMQAFTTALQQAGVTCRQKEVNESTG